jgi:hypothetical protein
MYQRRLPGVDRARPDRQHADPAVRIGGLATGHRKIERLTGREFDIPEG